LLLGCVEVGLSRVFLLRGVGWVVEGGGGEEGWKGGVRSVSEACVVELGHLGVRLCWVCTRVGCAVSALS
jgi:hypothetical protein